LTIALGGRDNQFGQAVRDLSDAFYLPRPTAAPVRPSLQERLWMQPAHLKQQHAILVVIIVGRDDLRIERRGAPMCSSAKPFALEPFLHILLGDAALEQ